MEPSSPTQIARQATADVLFAIAAIDQYATGTTGQPAADASILYPENGGPNAVLEAILQRAAQLEARNG